MAYYTLNNLFYEVNHRAKLITIFKNKKALKEKDLSFKPIQPEALISLVRNHYDCRYADNYITA